MHWKERIEKEYQRLDDDLKDEYRYARERLSKLINATDNEALLNDALKVEGGLEVFLHIAVMRSIAAGIYEDQA